MGDSAGSGGSTGLCAQEQPCLSVRVRWGGVGGGGGGERVRRAGRWCERAAGVTVGRLCCKRSAGDRTSGSTGRVQGSGKILGGAGLVGPQSGVKPVQVFHQGAGFSYFKTATRVEIFS